MPFTSGTPSPLAQSARVDCGCPHGLEVFSRLRSIAPASAGNRDSLITSARRRSTIVSTCSMSTGHSCTHAPQVVQAQTASSSTTSGTRASGSSASPAARAARIDGPSASAWSRRSMISSFGDRGLPVFQAGHALWHRPHSVHAPRSSRDFCVSPGQRVGAQRLLASLEGVHVDPQRLQGAARPGRGQPHVDRAGRDVQVLRVREVHEEPQHEREVHPQQDPHPEPLAAEGDIHVNRCGGRRRERRPRRRATPRCRRRSVRRCRGAASR